nr:MAG TPA: hypothetical protein [Caudoviricetes sp.]
MLFHLYFCCNHDENVFLKKFFLIFCDLPTYRPTNEICNTQM